MVDAVPPTNAKDQIDVSHASIAHLNGECIDSAVIDTEALHRTQQAQGAEWYGIVTERCPHLFAAVPVFISELQLQQMRSVIAAVDEVVKLPGLHAVIPVIPAQAGIQSSEKISAQRSQVENISSINPLDSGLRRNDENNEGDRFTPGVFYGYDFHLNAQGAHLIEINTNAGGAFINALLIDSQREASLYGAAVADENLENVFIEMFRNEWCLARGDVPLKTIAIVDDHPELQYLYPEFLLAQKWFKQAGIVAHIVDPSALQVREDDLFCNGERVDLIYNRLTDFDLQQYPHIRTAWEMRQVVVTPNPLHYQRYADKRKLALFSDGERLRAMDVSQASIDALLQGVPQTKLVHSKDAEQWWAERKQWFFKPVSGYGSKGAYRGDKLTKRVFDEIMQSDYVAQRMAMPGERAIDGRGVRHYAQERGGDAEEGVMPYAPTMLKFDVRCYVYDGHIQLIAARLYQGQTTNFRTPGGGFALVRQVN